VTRLRQRVRAIQAFAIQIGPTGHPDRRAVLIGSLMAYVCSSDFTVPIRLT